MFLSQLIVVDFTKENYKLNPGELLNAYYFDVSYASIVNEELYNAYLYNYDSWDKEDARLIFFFKDTSDHDTDMRKLIHGMSRRYAKHLLGHVLTVEHQGPLTHVGYKPDDIKFNIDKDFDWLEYKELLSV